MGIPLRPLAVAGAGRSEYRELPPPPALADVLACSWHGRTGWARPLRVLPDGCADLVWDGQSLAVVVAVAAPIRLWVPAGSSRVGVRFRCGAAGALLDESVADLPVTTPLSELWGATARRAEEQLSATTDPDAQRALLESLVAARPGRPDPKLLAAVHALGGARVAEVADGLGVSERALRRNLRHAAGTGPKQLDRIQRFRHFLRQLEPLAHRRTTLATVAAELGYADQSHLGRESRRLSGSAPAGLVRSWARVAEKFQTRPMR